MKIRLFGDHSNFHSGSAAVWAVLTDFIARCGHSIVDGDDYDMLVVNGEGTMHHGSPGFHRKMKMMRGALEGGRRAMLLNSVWEENPSDYDEVLRSLDAIVLRETCSAADLKSRHGINSVVSIDLSYFLDVPAGPSSQQFDDRMVVTDVYSRELSSFVSFSSGPLSKADSISLSSMPWDDLVRSLRSAKILITGRHHGVYAATKAKIPFLAFEGNTHKIAGFLQFSEMRLPILRTARDVPKAVEASLELGDAYQRLFTWMDRQRIEDAIPIGRA